MRKKIKKMTPQQQTLLDYATSSSRAIFYWYDQYDAWNRSASPEHGGKKEEGGFFTTSEVARVWGMSQECIHGLITLGIVVPHYSGRAFRFTGFEIDSTWETIGPLISCYKEKKMMDAIKRSCCNKR